MRDNTELRTVKTAQRKMALTVAGLVVLALLGIYWLVAEHRPVRAGARNSRPPHYVNPLDEVDTQSFVLEHTQKRLRDAEKSTAHLQQTVEAMAMAQQTDQDVTDSVKARLATLEKKLDDLSLARSSQTITPSSAMSANPFQSLPDQADGPLAGESMARDDVLQLVPTHAVVPRPVKTPDTYVPSGTFVKAVVIGGADASASVTAQANPKVMLLRLIENGTLPNQQHSHLKGCLAVGHVTGDISSERGSVRIERLSCVFPDDSVVDQKVEGIVFGPDGKVDVRGRVREGGQQYVGRAFAAGALSGLSEGISQTYTTNSISPLGNTQTIKPGKIFQVGAAKGTGKAMDKLADYQMRKAEQYHPVIQLSAGTVVDIVFQMGFFLDGQPHAGQKTAGRKQRPSSALFPETPVQEAGNDAVLSSDAMQRVRAWQHTFQPHSDRRTTP